MFVSEYRTFTTPTASTNRSSESATYAKRSEFTLPSRQKASLPPLFHSSYPNYIQNRNYYTNKERFSNRQILLESLQRLQHIVKQKSLAVAYEAVHVSFMDLTKPKKAISSNPFTLPKTLDENYKKLTLSKTKAVGSAIYAANDLYYKQAYAS